MSGVKALRNHQYGYRLRVGSYRVLFDVLDHARVVSIEEVKNAMNAPTDFQVIEQDGKPVFAVVPWDRFQEMAEAWQAVQAREQGIPQEVVERHVLDGVPLVVAWREHLGMTQAEVARRAGMKQSAVARIERGDSRPRHATLRRLASAMGLHPGQLLLDVGP